MSSSLSCCSPFRFAVLIGLCLAACFGCDRFTVQPPAPSQTNPKGSGFPGVGSGGALITPSSSSPREPQNPWPPQRIANDPEGFCVWADQQLREQLTLLEGNRIKLNNKLQQLASKKKTFMDNVDEIRNLGERAKTALRRADDEERWPVKFAGQSFSKEKLQALIGVTGKYVEQRTPLAEDYSRAAQRLNVEIRKIDEQVAEVKRQQEVVSLDLERIKLNNELDGLPQLDSSKLNITAITTNLARPSEADEMDLKIDELTTSENPPMTIEYFLKKD